ncbi:AAA family ATPase, partial [uncultured Muribaculum sp.]|uniref:AAA family ATPase n=1 Tax=uncultured Muribaculum sp. TaxID=1918613 RepID=UPI00272FF20A
TDPNDDARGLIDFICIRNITKGTLFEFRFKQEPGKAPMMHIVLPDESSKAIAEHVSELQTRKKELIELMASEGNLDKIADYKSETSKIDKVLKDALFQQKNAKDIEATVEMSQTLDYTSKYLLIDLLKDFVRYSEYPSNFRKGTKKYVLDTEVKDLIAGNKGKIEKLAGDINYLLDFFQIDYIQAHGVTQKMLFSVSDDSDHIAKTIKEFMQSRAWKNIKVRKFIKDQMKAFGIGYDFYISNENGEAFKVFILESEDDKTGFPLADLGMGSIQLMMLLFALGTSIKRNVGSVFGNSTVVIEEPEQNLHPDAQSKLATLLYEVNDKFGIKFIVETHSEYMIRRCQIIAAKALKDGKINPFRVYYFQHNDVPYDMGFQKNGKFIESFGPGFLDVADNAAIELFELEEDD